jgi:heme/copper-type cytochrome/quinol oxidase subunit 2
VAGDVLNLNKYFLFNFFKKYNNNNSIFLINFSLNNNDGYGYITKKIYESRLFYILKQKRSKKVQNISYKISDLFNEYYKVKSLSLSLNKVANGKFTYTVKSYHVTNKFKITTSKDLKFLLNRYKLKKFQNKRNEIFTFAMSKRLLRVKKILLIPTSTNIALVTSSYDVAHSLFIPAIGLKFDCVPGRATHHTLNIVHKGVYYAQCAEICGRYHHHMPAKIGVIFFEQFLN